MTRTGECYCGAIKYELDDDSKDGISCHCRTCQKLHTASSFNLKSQQDKVRVVKGTPKSYRDKKADAGSCITRYFCGDCGSALYSDPDSLPGVRFVKVGALEDAQDVNLVAEIYVDSALKHVVNPKERFGQKHFEGMMAKEV